MLIRILAVSIVMGCAAALGAAILSTTNVTCSGSPLPPSATITGTDSATYTAGCSTVGVSSGSVMATAAYGWLTSHAEIGPPGPAAISDTAIARFADQITIGGSVGRGFVAYVYDLSYQGAEDSGVASARFMATSDSKFTTNVSVLELGAIYSHGTTFVPGEQPSTGGVHIIRTSALADFTFGTPFNFGASVQSTASGSLINANLSAKLINIAVFDDNQQPLPGATITSLSRTIYTTTVPEPGSLTLLGLGLGVGVVVSLCGRRTKTR